MSILRLTTLLFVLTVAELTAIAPAHADETLTLGVFAYRPDSVLQDRYQPLTDYLSRETGIQIELEILNQENMSRAIAANRLDFFLTNPSHFLLIRSERSLTGVLATLVSATISRILPIYATRRSPRQVFIFSVAIRPRFWSCWTLALISGE